MSLGPDGIRSADDVRLQRVTDWPLWQRVVAAHPRLVSLIAAAYLALTWSALRGWRFHGPRRDVLYAALVVLPLAPLAWRAATTETAGQVELVKHLVVPGPVALAGSAWAMAFLLALGLRASTRAQRREAIERALT